MILTLAGRGCKSLTNGGPWRTTVELFRSADSREVDLPSVGRVQPLWSFWESRIFCNGFYPCSLVSTSSGIIDVDRESGCVTPPSEIVFRFTRGTADNLRNQLTVNIGQPHVPAVEEIGQPLVVRPKKVKDCSVDAIHTMRLLLDLITKLIAGGKSGSIGAT